jgi:hypothetical protein
MAVVEVKSGPITNRDADPRVLNDSATEGGFMKESVGTVEVTSGDSVGSTYIMCQIPSNARISSVRVDTDDMGTTTAADVGIYQTTENSNTVVDADHFASALSLNGGALADLEIQHESAVYGLEDAEKPLWEALGLSQDPHLFYDVVATLTGACDGTGTFTLRCRYTI